MSKSKKIIIVVLIIVFFSYGFAVGHYKIFPYRFLQDIKEITSPEKEDDFETYIYEKNVTHLIHISSPADVIEKRKSLINYIWSGNDIPYDKTPLVETGIIDSRYDDVDNLDRIDRITTNMDYGVNSIAYLFMPHEPHRTLIIYHQGHDGDFILGEKTIQYFIERGYPILAFSMPLLGMNNQPTVDIPNLGTIKLKNHNDFIYLESSRFSSIKFFVEPIAVSLNYADKLGFDSYVMVGISGGGWTTTLYSSIDDRISESYSVAGSVPTFLRSIPGNEGDYEQRLPTLYNMTNYLDLYIMSSFGDNRKHVEIYNMYDPCCFGGDVSKTYEKEINTAMSKLHSGKFMIYVDNTHKEHKISQFSLDIIINSISKYQ
jgi:hypothetical protein